MYDPFQVFDHFGLITFGGCEPCAFTSPILGEKAMVTSHVGRYILGNLA